MSRPSCSDLESVWLCVCMCWRCRQWVGDERAGRNEGRQRCLVWWGLCDSREAPAPNIYTQGQLAEANQGGCCTSLRATWVHEISNGNIHICVLSNHNDAVIPSSERVKINKAARRSRPYLKLIYLW
jgi:hypothetical protein